MARSSILIYDITTFESCYNPESSPLNKCPPPRTLPIYSLNLFHTIITIIYCLLSPLLDSGLLLSWGSIEMTGVGLLSCLLGDLFMFIIIYPDIQCCLFLFFNFQDSSYPLSHVHIFLTSKPTESEYLYTYIITFTYSSCYSYLYLFTIGSYYTVQIQLFLCNRLRLSLPFYNRFQALLSLLMVELYLGHRRSRNS